MRTLPGAEPAAGSPPYPWPYDGRLVPARTAVVVAGAQRGLAHSPAAAAALDATRALAHAAGAAGASVVLVRHGRRRPGRRPEIPLRGAPEWWLVEGIEADVAVDAAGIDGFYGSDLDDVLRRWAITHLVLAGLGLETHVHSTLRTANDLGYECALAIDACAAVDPALRAPATRIVEMSGGIFGSVVTTTALIEAFGRQEER